MNETLVRYHKRVARWRELYPIPDKQYDPSQVKAMLKCARCGSSNNITRHHKGHEYLFSLIAPYWYAARYVKFEAEDWVPLCTSGLNCHVEVHREYSKIVAEIVDYVAIRQKRVTHDKYDLPEFEWIFKPNKKTLESFRKRLIEKCDQWLGRGNKKKPKKYRDHKERQYKD